MKQWLLSIWWGIEDMGAAALQGLEEIGLL